MSRQKSEIITFKADPSLMEAMQYISNRSEFIRNAILGALENTCPLCNGTGILTSNQRKHWKEFAETHTVEKCQDCHEAYLVCRR